MADFTTGTHLDNSKNDSNMFVFEDYTQRIIIVVVLCMVFIIGWIGNTLVIAAVVLSKRLHSVTNYFIVNLACADILTCVVIPFQMLAVLGQNGFPLPEWVCAVASAIGLVCLGASIDSLALIAYNRWYLLTQSKAKFQRLYTKRKILLMVLCAWSYPSILVLVPHFAGLGRLGYSAKYKTCTQDTSLPYSDYYSFLAGAASIIPVFIATAVIYAKIYRFVSKQNKKMARMSRSEVAKSMNKRNIDRLSIEMSSSSSPGQNTTSSEPNLIPEEKTNHPDANKRETTKDARISTITISSEISTRESSSNGDRSQIRVTADGTTLQEKTGHSGLGVDTPMPKQRKSNKRLTSKQPNRHQVTVTKKLAIVVLAFFICLLPFGISVTIRQSKPGIPWTGMMLSFNCCVNPIIYARTMPVFREVMGCIIRCRFQTIR